MHGPRFHWLGVATPVIVVGAALAAVIVITGSSSASRVPPVPSPSHTASSPLVPKFSRSEAEAAAGRGLSGTITREASKLTTEAVISNFVTAWQGGQPTVGLPGSLNPRIGWVVVVAGSICRCDAWEPMFLPPGNSPWAVFAYDATTGQLIGVFLAASASAETWPPGWDEIYDMAG